MSNEYLPNNNNYGQPPPPPQQHQQQSYPQPSSSYPENPGSSYSGQNYDTHNPNQIIGNAAVNSILSSLKANNNNNAHTHSTPPADSTTPLANLDNNNKFFLANMAYSVGPEDAKQFFSKFGLVNHVKIVYDKSGKSKGYGFLFMMTNEGAVAVDQFASSQNNRIAMLGRPNVYCARNDESRVNEPGYPSSNNNYKRERNNHRNNNNNRSRGGRRDGYDRHHRGGGRDRGVGHYGNQTDNHNINHHSYGPGAVNDYPNYSSNQQQQNHYYQPSMGNNNAPPQPQATQNFVPVNNNNNIMVGGGQQVQQMPHQYNSDPNGNAAVNSVSLQLLQNQQAQPQLQSTGNTYDNMPMGTQNNNNQYNIAQQQQPLSQHAQHSNNGNLMPSTANNNMYNSTSNNIVNPNNNNNIQYVQSNLPIGQNNGSDMYSQPILQQGQIQAMNNSNIQPLNNMNQQVNNMVVHQQVQGQPQQSYGQPQQHQNQGGNYNPNIGVIDAQALSQIIQQQPQQQQQQQPMNNNNQSLGIPPPPPPPPPRFQNNDPYNQNNNVVNVMTSNNNNNYNNVLSQQQLELQMQTQQNTNFVPGQDPQPDIPPYIVVKNNKQNSAGVGGSNNNKDTSGNPSAAASNNNNKGITPNVLIQNLPLITQISDLMDFFTISHNMTVRNIKIEVDTSKKESSCAHVVFLNVDDAANIISRAGYNDLVFKGRNLMASVDQTGTVSQNNNIHSSFSQGGNPRRNNNNNRQANRGRIGMPGGGKVRQGRSNRDARRSTQPY